MTLPPPGQTARQWPDPREVVPQIGQRATTLFSFAIVSGRPRGAGAERYRHILEASGELLDAAEVTEAEQVLIDWGRLLGTDASAVDSPLRVGLETRFSAPLRVALLQFACELVAADLYFTARDADFPMGDAQ